MIHIDSHSLSRPFEGPASRPRLMIWLHKLSPALFGLFIALTGIAGLVLNFGSLASATAFLAGHGVVIEEAEKDLGMVPLDDQRKAHFRLQNLSRREITILGAKSPCTWPMSCMPMGRPWVLKPTGTFSAGKPHKLAYSTTSIQRW